MRTSEKTEELFAALAKAQGEFPDIPRAREVEVYSRRTNSKYKFRYAPLDVIFKAVRPALAKYQLCVTQGMSDDQQAVVTRLGHASGQWVEHSIKLVQPESMSIQDLGGLITYCKRYGAEAALGVVATDDDDGNGATGNDITSQRDRHPDAGIPANDVPPTRPVPAHVVEGIFDTTGWATSEEHEFAFAIDKRETEGQYGKPASYWNAWEQLIADKKARKGTKKAKNGKDLACYFRTMVEVPAPLMDWLNDVLIAVDEAGGPGDEAVLAWLRAGVEKAGSTADKWTEAQRQKVLQGAPERLKEMAAEVLT